MAVPMHLALLGDSIFDNAAYTGGEPDVVTHLRAELPIGAYATLCAVDGATISSLRHQLGCVPAAATHLVVSIGGNDVLQHFDLLSLRVTSSAEALTIIGARLLAFERAYRSALADVLALGRPTTMCTIYNGALDSQVATVARLALALFNDVILRAAIERHVDVIELRAICNEPHDYANPIEPSGSGGLKIARAIARAVGAAHGPARSARVFA
jgi:hypothetical protein